MELQGKSVLLGVTGGIAAYKAAELTRLLIKKGAKVHVAMTEAATHFVGPVTFQALTGQAVYCEQWETNVANGMAHIDLTRMVDAVLIAPATADFIAKLANGIADDLLSSLVLARDCPLLVAPAMNKQMWQAAPTQRNVAQLEADGVAILGPGVGEQACGEIGAGRMLEPAELLEGMLSFFTPKLLAGKRVLMTAGPTFESIDAVRGITNLSSGRMGYAVAAAAARAGAAVTLVTPAGVERIDVKSARDMHAAVMARAAEAHIFIGVAAVADYRVANVAEHKLKKDEGGPPALQLVENPDILAEVAALPKPPFCVGFAAESQNLEDYAQKKRLKKKIPLIVGNLIQEGFGGEENRVVLFDDHGVHPLALATKPVLARQLIEHIARSS
ncbi:MAG: Coenzyme A biosynthesis bifunctional protein CoaBC [Betaproteobacteria bacterium ADurb.Bin341]|nr:MAG: Coenzyme A biosynthesis bifunctional protein CoaBC [Betaproteobacteria bacterium ADurb.Bin341]